MPKESELMVARSAVENGMRPEDTLHPKHAGCTAVTCEPYRPKVALGLVVRVPRGKGARE